MALSGYAALVGYGAALGIFACAHVAVRKGWARRGVLFRPALMVLAGMLAQGSTPTHLMDRWIGGDSPGVLLAAHDRFLHCRLHPHGLRGGHDEVEGEGATAIACAWKEWGLWTEGIVCDRPRYKLFTVCLHLF